MNDLMGQLVQHQPISDSRISHEGSLDEQENLCNKENSISGNFTARGDKIYTRQSSNPQISLTALTLAQMNPWEIVFQMSILWNQPPA